MSHWTRRTGRAGILARYNDSITLANWKHSLSTLVVKNLPAHLHEALKARARRHHRSLNREAASIIEQAVRAGDTVRTQQAPAAEGQPLTLEELEVALSDDRYGSLGPLTDVEELMDELRAERVAPPE